MCTLTIGTVPDGARLIAMNRDERTDRARGAAPSWRRLGARDVLAPTDAEAGGTWFGARTDGCWAALLNAYDGEVPAAPRSRGSLVLDALALADPAAVPAAAFASRRPCRLFVGGAAGCEELAWDGRAVARRAHPEPCWQLHTSSSWREVEVAAFRRRQFADWTARGAPLDPDGVPTLHRTDGGDACRGVRVRRGAVATVSITLARWDAARLRMDYWPTA